MFCPVGAKGSVEIDDYEDLESDRPVKFQQKTNCYSDQIEVSFMKDFILLVCFFEIVEVNRWLQSERVLAF